MKMGRRPRIRRNPALAKDHAAGTTVMVVQPVEHSTFGAINYAWGPLWPEHFQLAEAAAEQLAALHQRVLGIEPGPSRCRYVDDLNLLRDAYEICNAMVSHSVRAVQHLAQDIEHQRQGALRGLTSAERIREAAKWGWARRPCRFSTPPNVRGVRMSLNSLQRERARSTTKSRLTFDAMNDDRAEIPLCE
jgi:hypothetical protein